MSKAAFRAALRQDDKVSAFFEALESLRSSLNCTRIIAEIKSLHATRPSRKLYKVKLQPTPLYEAITDDLRVRARLTEIRLDIYERKGVLDNTLQGIKRYTLHAFADYLADIPSASTAAGRKSLVDAVFADAEKFQAEIETVESMIQSVLDDIQQAGYGLSNARSILTVLIDRKDQIV